MGNGMEIHPLSFLFFGLAFLLPSTLHVSGEQYPINVWPKPTTFLWPEPQVTLLSPHLGIEIPSNKHLVNYVQHTFFKLQFNESYQPLVEPPLNLTSTPLLRFLFIKVADPNATLTHGVNETYTLRIPAPYGSEPITATMTAQTVWGAMRGLETFSQLIYGSPARVACGLFIRDEPLFIHRGVMLDTSRNYYGVKDLKRLIRAMSMNKLNVFHWHITDSQSFPLVLPSKPQLTERGAYGKKMKYTPDDVKKVVKFGLDHGVRVVPEIEMPAHVGSWATAFPDIVTCANKFWFPPGPAVDRFANEPGTGQLNPLNPKTYRVVENVIRDVAAMFPDSFFHAGADEINSNCWKSDPTIQAFLAKNGTLSQVLEIFVNSTLPFILSQNRTVVYWEDVILDEAINVSLSLLPQENVILQSWTNWRNSTKKIVSAGYRTIVSSMDFYYLDRGHGTFLGNYSQYNLPPGSYSEGTWYPPFITWQTIYNYDITYGLNEEEAKLVLGGEAALWSEQADPTVMDSRIWPRTSAMAEALWSGNRDETGMKRFAEATDRLNEWRNRMVNRGIGAEPIQPLWCVKNPGMCNMVN